MDAKAIERGLASLRTHAAVTQALLGLFVLASALVAIAALLIAVQEIQTGYARYMASQPLFALFIGGMLLPAAIALSLWVWRAHGNLHAQAVPELEFSASWAATTHWIPVANLAVPKRAMRELWNRSHGEEPWFAQQSVDTINSWWTCHVVGILIVTAMTLMVLFDRLTNVAFVTPPGTNMLAMAFACSLLALAAWFLIRIIGTITKAQQRVTHVGDTFT